MGRMVTWGTLEELVLGLAAEVCGVSSGCRNTPKLNGQNTAGYMGGNSSGV